MHYIQKKILDKLIYNETQRYSELKPAGIESNNFAYHLKELLKAGLLIKRDRGYFLSPQGKAYVDRVSHETLDIRKQPKIITLLSLTNNKGELLLTKRNHQPYIDYVGYPSGKLHVGERVMEAAQREVKEKLGIEAQKLEQLGVLNIAISEANYVVSHVLAVVYAGEVTVAAKPLNNRRAEYFWTPQSSIREFMLIPGFLETQRLIASGDEFFGEFEFSL